MATARVVKVVVSDSLIYEAVMAPGGDANKWLKDLNRKAGTLAKSTAPVDDPANAATRGGVVGTYKASFGGGVRNAGMTLLVGEVYNRSDHAVYVEEGRRHTRKRQVFTWTGARKNIKQTRTVSGRGAVIRTGVRQPLSTSGGGAYRTVPNPGGWVSTPRTKARKGKHILKNAVNAVLVSEGIPPLT